MGCPKHVVDSGNCPEANKKNNNPKPDPNSCYKAKSFIDLILQRQEQYRLKNNRFGTFGQIGLGNSPNPNDYDYSLDYLGSNYVKVSARHRLENMPYVVGYIYIQKIFNTTVIRKITGVSKIKKTSFLIKDDIEQTSILRLESGFNNNC